ncbi:hypothetical protein [Pedobacter jamesrossensis]|uniref:Uncharacterized protein n=1 Tax=Pedobacter jamesrossensis TaxID=1908238 RepID=A0ABV8NL91_9SPHI
MVRIKLIIFFMLFVQVLSAQTLHLRKRKANALEGKAFALTINDSTLSLKDREDIILKEIRRGNVPDFLRNLYKLNIKADSTGAETVFISIFVLPDYLSIGSNNDFFYVPMTPILAQRIANLTNCILPTKSLVDDIHVGSEIKLKPQPINPSKAMTTVPVFIAHTDSVLNQLEPFLIKHTAGALTAGNKKDIIISNKIYGEPTPRVVIYGWHKLDGKAIQPVYNKHTNTWADYSHGVRLIQNKIYINNKKTTLKRALTNPKLSRFFSEEGVIKKPYYPVYRKY